MGVELTVNELKAPETGQSEHTYLNNLGEKCGLGLRPASCIFIGEEIVSQLWRPEVRQTFTTNSECIQHRATACGSQYLLMP
jgi:hypothetical protein